MYHESIIHHQSSISSHLIDFPSLEQGWMGQTSLQQSGLQQYLLLKSRLDQQATALQEKSCCTKRAK